MHKRPADFSLGELYWGEVQLAQKCVDMLARPKEYDALAVRMGLGNYALFSLAISELTHVDERSEVEVFAAGLIDASADAGSAEKLADIVVGTATKRCNIRSLNYMYPGYPPLRRAQQPGDRCDRSGNCQPSSGAIMHEILIELELEQAS